VIAALICLIRGHKRGKRLTMTMVTSTTPFNTYECPRCKATWTRKAK
jgi:hypothetical protein